MKPSNLEGLISYNYLIKQRTLKAIKMFLIRVNKTGESEIMLTICQI